jgi:hypothetical protein
MDNIALGECKSIGTRKLQIESRVENCMHIRRRCLGRKSLEASDLEDYSIVLCKRLLSATSYFLILD